MTEAVVTGSFDVRRVDAEDFLESLRVRNVEMADLENWRFSCPFPGHQHGDENASAYMRDDTTAWYCFGCKRSGNAVTFLAEYEGVSELEARRWLREAYGGGFREPEGGAAREWIRDRMAAQERAEAPEQTYLDESLLDRYWVDWADAYMEWEQTKCGGPVGYMFNRGFEPETLMDWEIGYDDRGQRFTIPVRDHEGRLVGFKGRAWDPERKPKYLVLGDKPGRTARYGYPTYEKSLVVFGLHKAEPAPHRPLILVEGELNRIAMHQKGWPNCGGIAGSDLSPAQARLIRDYADEAILFFDSDPAGDSAAWGWTDEKGRFHPGAVDALEPFMRVGVVPPHEGDPADMDTEDIRRCVHGAMSSVAMRAFVEVPDARRA